MERFEWDPALETGDERVDADHRHLFEVFNNLSCGSHSDDPGLVLRTLEELTAYALIHFEHEETLMREHQYPAHSLIEHQKEHGWFAQVLRDQVIEYHREGSVPVRALCAFLHEWLTDHVRELDRALVDYLRTRAVRVGPRDLGEDLFAFGA